MILSLISTVALAILVILGILEYRRNRANIEVTVKGEYVTSLESFVGSTKIIITAINTGRRPVTLIQAGLLLPIDFEDEYFIAKDSIKNIRLKERDSYNYVMD